MDMSNIIERRQRSDLCSEISHNQGLDTALLTGEWVALNSRGEEDIATESHCILDAETIQSTPGDHAMFMEKLPSTGADHDGLPSINDLWLNRKVDEAIEKKALRDQTASDGVDSPVLIDLTDDPEIGPSAQPDTTEYLVNNYPPLPTPPAPLSTPVQQPAFWYAQEHSSHLMLSANMGIATGVLLATGSLQGASLDGWLEMNGIHGEEVVRQIRQITEGLEAAGSDPAIACEADCTTLPSSAM